jgi:uncharacterized protein
MGLIPASVVTGASSGLGAAIAARLTARGHCVVGVARRGTSNTTVAEMRSCDISDYSQVKRLTDDLQDRYAIEYLFNVAGSPGFCAISDIDDAVLDETLSGNLYGLVYMSACLVTGMKQAGHGAIVGILSTAALTGRPDEGPYTAAKWGARGFLEALRADCKGTGVHVVSIYPGGMNTPFWQHQSHLNPKVETYMDPTDVAKQVIDTVVTSYTVGHASSLTIER